ncbi:hypothetical protein HK105_202419 [Polyrhizophydium stewartii]|uniref:Uncharacterized protein n=1 Tax=Polyrhizophydium stewartii TaxID=2732419 RepID=A0ABR4NEP3_9FUNG
MSEPALAAELRHWAQRMGYGIDTSIGAESVAASAPATGSELSDAAAQELCRQQLQSLWSFLVQRVRPQSEARRIRNVLALTPPPPDAPVELGDRARRLADEMAAALARRDRLAAAVAQEEDEQRELRRKLDDACFEASRVRRRVAEKQRKLMVADAHAKRLHQESAFVLHDAQQLAQLVSTPRDRAAGPGSGAAVAATVDEEAITTDMLRIVNGVASGTTEQALDRVRSDSARVDAGRLAAAIKHDTNHDVQFVAELAKPKPDAALAAHASRGDPSRLAADLSKQHTMLFVQTQQILQDNSMVKAEIDNLMAELEQRLQRISLDVAPDEALVYVAVAAESHGSRAALQAARDHAKSVAAETEVLKALNRDTRTGLSTQQMHQQTRIAFERKLEALRVLVTETQKQIELNRAMIAENQAMSVEMSDPDALLMVDRLTRQIEQAGGRLFELSKKTSISRSMAAIRGNGTPDDEWQWSNNELMIQIRKQSEGRKHKSFAGFVEDLEARKRQKLVRDNLLANMNRLNKRARGLVDSGRGMADRAAASGAESWVEATQQYMERIAPTYEQSLRQAELSQKVIASMEELVAERNWFVHERQDPFAEGPLADFRT